MSSRRATRGFSLGWFGLVVLGLCVYFSWHRLQDNQQPVNTAEVPVIVGERGRVVAVSDGDSLVVSLSRDQISRGFRIRLEGIDAPEFGQPYHRRAKWYLSGLCRGKEVNVRTVDQDRYGRLVARVFVEDRDLSLEMLRAGLAWHFVRYNSEVELATAQMTARKRRLGLWQDEAPVKPWVWRQRHPD